jgi:hypothetical protein
VIDECVEEAIMKERDREETERRNRMMSINMKRRPSGGSGDLSIVDPGSCSVDRARKKLRSCSRMFVTALSGVGKTEVQINLRAYVTVLTLE